MIDNHFQLLIENTEQALDSLEPGYINFDRARKLLKVNLALLEAIMEEMDNEE